MRLIRMLSLVVLTGLSFQAYPVNQNIPMEKTIVEDHSYSDGATLVYSPAGASDYGCTGNGAYANVHVSWAPTRI